MFCLETMSIKAVGREWGLGAFFKFADWTNYCLDYIGLLSRLCPNQDDDIQLHNSPISGDRPRFPRIC